ncbi:hypothetical protein GN244_ATG15394 [Phytophthora infestans]|uniref:WW domain-containing protein n=1 Tax=Phytophthora infestans TaxID=4787 RepID=A0A833SVF7_PHYIN|nr:hypothetical protein GN244_ATG15394 [Phytophthora infestans]KAF4138351.1 hypothetical protein GN958_ATG12505 [Phytophthora infestans]
MEQHPSAESGQHGKNSSFSGNNKHDYEQNDSGNASPIDKQDPQSMSEMMESTALVAMDALPLVDLSIAKRDRHRSRKRDRHFGTKTEAPSASISSDSGDNQTTHLSRKNRIVDTHSSSIDESTLPQILKSAVSYPQNLNVPLRKLHNHRTWHGSLKQRGDNGISRSFQRRRSSCDDTLAAFEATETILLAELESDERCASFLRQRVPEARISYSDGIDSPQSQIQYKVRALDRKILMNKEKLTQVRERIAELGGKPSRLAIDFDDNNSELIDNDKMNGQVKEIKQSAQALTSMQRVATTIQCAFRAFRARRHLATLLATTYQRVLNPGNNQYFYYNRVTRHSQWEAPTLLRRCHYSLDAKPATLANPRSSSVDAAAKVIQAMLRQRALRVFMQDYKLGNLEKIFDARFGAWYYFNSRTNRSFWENVHHVRLTAANSAIYHHQPIR